MKIRIQGNSVRFRLSRPEVELFKKQGFVAEKTEFAGNSFQYEIKMQGDSSETMDASFTGQKLTLYVPQQMASAWTETDSVGFSDRLPLGEDKTLFLLVEKDFKCIDGDMTEDQSDYYDNPLKSC